MANIGVASITIAKLTAILYGLQMGWQCGFRWIQVSVNFTAAITLMQDCHNPAHPATGIIGRIRPWIQREWMVQFYHVFRESNRVANAPSHVGHDRSIGVHFYEDALSRIWSLLNHDAAGLATLQRGG